MGKFVCAGPSRAAVPWLRRAAAALVVAASAPAGAEEILVESREGGENVSRYQEIEGKWVSSQSPPEATKSAAPGLRSRTIGTRRMQFYRPDSEKVDPLPAAARFLPMVQTRGRYRVEITWPKSANAAPVAVIIRHAEGNTRKEIEQNGRGFHGPGNPDRWTDLGVYEFAPGPDHYVELRAEEGVRPVDPGSYGQVVADAVRFTRLADGDGGTAAGTLVWHDSIEKAMQEAGASGRRILVFFDGPSCEVCRAYDKVFAAEAVVDLLSREYVVARLNLTEFGRERAHRLGVFRGGTINVYNSRGEALGQITETLSANELLQRLRDFGR